MFIRKILSLACEYGWEKTGYDELQSGLVLFLQVHEEICHIKRDKCYVTVNHCLNEEDKHFIIEALNKAIEDIPDKAVHTDVFNPEIGSYRMDSLYEKNLYYKVIYWGWDNNKQELLHFVEDLKEEIEQSQLKAEVKQQGKGVVTG